MAKGHFPIRFCQIVVETAAVLMAEDQCVAVVNIDVVVIT